MESKPATSKPSSAVRKLEEQLTCSVCLELYINPKTLPCLHSFCEACIEQLPQDKRNDTYYISCPTCRHCTELPGRGAGAFPVAFTLNNFIDFHSLLKKVSDPQQVTCDNCNAANATGYCKVCSQFLCQQCIVKHNEWSRFASHQITSLDEVTTIPGEEGAASLPIAFELNNFREIYDKMKASEQRPSSSSSGSYGLCHIHRREMEIFCDTCNAVICINCTRESHKDHDWNTVAESYQRYCHNLRSQLTPLRQKMSSLQDSCIRLKYAEKEIKEQEDKVKKEINMTANEIIEAIRQSERKLTDEIEAASTNKILVINSQKLSAESSLSQLKKYDEYFRDAVENGRDKPQLVLMAKQHMLKRMAETIENVNAKDFSPIEKADMNLVKGSDPFIGRLEYSALTVQQCKINVGSIKKGRDKFEFSLSINLPSSPVFLSVPVSSLSCTLVPVSGGQPILTTVTNTPQSDVYSIEWKPSTSGSCTVEVKLNGFRLGDAPQVTVPRVPSLPIGIDLGTAYSCIGVFRNDKVEIIPNENGNKTTPSFVAFNDMERLIGDSAKNQRAMNPLGTMFDAKRLIGRRSDDPIIQHCRRYWPFKIVDVNGRPAVEVEYKGEVRVFCAEEILAMILGRMKDIAEEYLGCVVTDVVITIPAYFNYFHHQATRDAAAIAGLNCIRIVIEPFAAAMAYGFENKVVGERQLVAFDLGAGCLNVAVVTIEDNIFEVKSVSSLSDIGGNEFDKRLVDYFAQEFKRKHRKDLFTNTRSVTRLMVACERAKRTLSSSNKASVEVDSLFEGIDFYSSITRDKFEEICSDLSGRFLKPVEKALRDARITKDKIDDIMVVGGSTRVPMVEKLLQDYFNGRKINRSVNPDEAVAYGASIQAAILSGDRSMEIQDFILLPVTPFSLGVETAGGVLTPVIKRNSTFPKKEEVMFATYHDNQTSILIKVYEGDRAMTKDNVLLGRFLVSGIPAAPQGEPIIGVTFSIDRNHNIDIYVLYKGDMSQHVGDKDGEKINLKPEALVGVEEQQSPDILFYHINNGPIKFQITRMSRSSKLLSIDEIDHMVATGEALKADDDQERQRVSAKNTLESYAFEAKSRIEEEGNQTDQQLGVVKKCSEVIDWLDQNQYAEKEEFDHQLKELEKVCTPVIAALDLARAGARK